MAEEQRPAFLIRPCFQQDIEQVQLIYAHHVMTGTGTFELAPPPREEMEQRWSKVVMAGAPYLVACAGGDPTRIAGFAYAQQFRDREAYAKTFEDSIYMAPNFAGKGAGKLLLNALIEQLEEMDVREVIAVIGDSANAASIGLHSSLGFHETGVLNRVGRKFGRWLDVVLMQRSLADR